MSKMLIRFITDQLRWVEWKYPWLLDGEIPAEHLLDLSPKNNELSIFEFEDEQELFRIAAAYGVQRQKKEKLDYICFDRNIIEKVKIKSDNNKKGMTPDDKVNQLHIDLVELSAEKIISLAHELLDNGKTGRILERDLFQMIDKNISLGWIPQKGLPQAITDGLTKWKSFF
ncbi:MAG: hypothetical protein WA821_06920 [Anaerolineales bacterium]